MYEVNMLVAEREITGAAAFKPRTATKYYITQPHLACTHLACKDLAYTDLACMHIACTHLACTLGLVACMGVVRSVAATADFAGPAGHPPEAGQPWLTSLDQAGRPRLGWTSLYLMRRVRGRLAQWAMGDLSRGQDV
jgi:hypothetical protein